ncbi:MAG: polysaccharide biosynthesis/export family protein [Pyrinomonadaceae bacterium]
MRNVRVPAVMTAIFLAAVISAFGQSAVPPAAAPADKFVAGIGGQDDRYRIGSEDVLNIQVFRHPDLSQRVTVNPNGTIVLFRLDTPVVATCKTPRELEAEIAKAYKAKFIRDPQVNVTAEQKSQWIGVIGAVAKPGTIYIGRRLHLLEMLAIVGGPSQEAGTRLFIARTGSRSSCREAGGPDTPDTLTFGLKLRDIQEGKQTFWLEPGDVVSVSDADIVYVYGDVNKQGPVKVREPITLTQAIVSAEGLKRAAKKDKVRVLRQREGSAEREEMVFDLNQIDKGKIKDPLLEPNDIVAVSEDRMKSILQGVGDTLKGTIPNVIYRMP